MKIHLRYRPYNLQRNVHRCDARTRVLRLGRRSGKTVLCMAEAIRRCMAARRRYDVGWIAPTYEVANRGRDAYLEICAEAIKAKVTTARWTYPAEIRIGSGRIHLLSAHKPDTIRGNRFDLVIVDEAAYISDRCWHEAIRSTMMDNDAPAILCSTPAGAQGFFHEADMLGQSGTNPRYASFHWTAENNPYISKTAWQALRDELPERARRQELDAEYLDGSGCLVSSVANAHTNAECRCITPPATGLDLARKYDHTAIACVCPSCGIVRRAERVPVQGRSWEEIVEDVYSRWMQSTGGKGAAVNVDATGVGDAVAEMLVRRGMPVNPIVWTGPGKRDMVTRLAIGIEKGALRWNPELWPEIGRELETYVPTLHATGWTGWGARAGSHDDVLSALMMAWENAQAMPACVITSSMSAMTLGEMHGEHEWLYED
jgi:hypothetical protein